MNTLRSRQRELSLRRAAEVLENYSKLSASQQQSARDAWKLFKLDPFDPRLGAHRINSLSAIFKRTVHAVVIEGDLRAVFYIEGDTVVTVNIGSHDIYKR